MTDEIPVTESTGTHSDSEWKRAGFTRFKEAMVHCDLEARRVAIRFSESSGRFGACLADVTFYSTDYKALVKRLGAHLASLQALVFDRYLDVDYEQRCESERTGHGSKHWRGEGKGAVTQVGLAFDVYDVSSEYATAVHGRGRAGTSKARVWRLLRIEDGNWVQAIDDDMRHVHGDYDPFKTLIPFTEERYQTLLGLMESLGKIAEVLNAMFGDKALESGKGVAMLDSVSGQKLLPAPPAPSKKPKKKGRPR